MSKAVCLAWLLAFATHSSFATEDGFPHVKANTNGDYLDFSKGYLAPRQGSSSDWKGDKKPLKITNKCPDTLWPALLTQHGVGPDTGGFELDPGKSKTLWGDVPATLAEFTLAGGIANEQTFYDISLVDGYNLPMAINYIPAANTTFIPPNLTNAACIATAGYLAASAMSGEDYSNSSYPIPWEPYESNDSARDWCPWSLLAYPPDKPGDGIYPYPDDKIKRPDFSPCLSQCASTNRDEDCCVGEYHDPEICKPGRYSSLMKTICPDAYSFAFDDQQSTFIIPSGGGWEVLFCPAGRSTTILRTLGQYMSEVAASGRLTGDSLAAVSNLSYIEKRAEETAAAPGLVRPASSWALSVAIGGMLLAVL
ncbi:hypothetical protein ACHAQH_007397 [Verticillium albo-atrum]